MNNKTEFSAKSSVKVNIFINKTSTFNIWSSVISQCLSSFLQIKANYSIIYWHLIIKIKFYSNDNLSFSNYAVIS